MKVEYDSNNSGGSWWLSDEQWKALEDAGWEVDWYSEQEDYSGRPYPDGSFLGALASTARIDDVESVDVAVAKWEAVTGEYAYEQGCNCCGRPHDFYRVDSDNRMVF